MMSAILYGYPGYRWAIKGNGAFPAATDTDASDPGYFLVGNTGVIGSLTSSARLEVYFDTMDTAPTVSADAFNALSDTVDGLLPSSLANNVAISGNLDPATAATALWHTDAGVLLPNVAQLQAPISSVFIDHGILQAANCGAVSGPTYTLFYKDEPLSADDSGLWYFASAYLYCSDVTKFPTVMTIVGYDTANASVTLSSKTHGFDQLDANVRRYWVAGQMSAISSLKNMSYGFGAPIAGTVAQVGGFTFAKGAATFTQAQTQADEWYYFEDISATLAAVKAGSEANTAFRLANIGAQVTSERPQRWSVISDSRAFGTGYLTQGNWLSYVESFLLGKLAQTVHAGSMTAIGTVATYAGNSHYLGTVCKASGVNSGFSTTMYGDTIAAVIGKERGNAGAALIGLYVDGALYDTFSTYSSEPFSTGNTYSGTGDGTSVKFDLGACWTYNHVVTVGGIAQKGSLNTQIAGGTVPVGDDYMVIRQAVGTSIHHVIEFAVAPTNAAAIACTYDKGESVTYMQSYLGNTTKPISGTLESAFADGSISFDTTDAAAISSSVGFRQTDERAIKTWRFTSSRARIVRFVILGLDTRATGVTPELYLNCVSTRLHRIQNAGLGGYDAGELLTDTGVNNVSVALQWRPDGVFVDLGTNDDNSLTTGARTSSAYRTLTNVADATIRNDESANYYSLVTNTGAGVYTVHDDRIPLTAVTATTATFATANATFSVNVGDVLVLGDYRMDNRRVAPRIITAWDNSTKMATWGRPLLVSDLAQITALSDLTSGNNCGRIWRNANFVSNITSIVALIRAVNPHARIILGCPGMPNENYRSLEGYRELISSLADTLSCDFCDHYGITRSWQNSQPPNTQLYLDASQSTTSTGASSYTLYTSAGVTPSATSTMLRGWSVMVDGLERINNGCHITGGKKTGFSTSGTMSKTGPKAGNTILTGANHVLTFTSNVPAASAQIVVKYTSTRWASDDTHPFTNGLPLFGQASSDAIQPAVVALLGKLN